MEHVRKTRFFENNMAAAFEFSFHSIISTKVFTTTGKQNWKSKKDAEVDRKEWKIIIDSRLRGSKDLKGSKYFSLQAM